MLERLAKSLLVLAFIGIIFGLWARSSDKGPMAVASSLLNKAGLFKVDKQKKVVRESSDELYDQSRERARLAKQSMRDQSLDMYSDRMAMSERVQAQKAQLDDISYDIGQVKQQKDRLMERLVTDNASKYDRIIERSKMLQDQQRITKDYNSSAYRTQWNQAPNRISPMNKFLSFVGNKMEVMRIELNGGRDNRDALQRNRDMMRDRQSQSSSYERNDYNYFKNDSAQRTSVSDANKDRVRDAQIRAREQMDRNKDKLMDQRAQREAVENKIQVQREHSFDARFRYPF